MLQSHISNEVATFFCYHLTSKQIFLFLVLLFYATECRLHAKLVLLYLYKYLLILFLGVFSNSSRTISIAANRQ